MLLRNGRLFKSFQALILNQKNNSLIDYALIQHCILAFSQRQKKELVLAVMIAEYSAV